MQEDDPFSIDYDELKRRLREAMRTAIQERADELGLSYGAFLERYFGSDRRPDGGDNLTTPASSQ